MTAAERSTLRINPMASKAAPSLRDDPAEPGSVTGFDRPETNGFPALVPFAPQADSAHSDNTVKTGAAANLLGGRVLVLNASFEPINVCTVRRAIDAIPADVWFDDPNGAPKHRKHLTEHFAEEIRAELIGGVR